MLNLDSQVIFLLCASLNKGDGGGEEYQPLTAGEWYDLALKINNSDLKVPGELLHLSEEEMAVSLELSPFDASRLYYLLGRSGQAMFEYERFTNQGYKIITRADVAYPRKLKGGLKEEAPPFFWVLGSEVDISKTVVSFVVPNNSDLAAINQIDHYLSKVDNSSTVISLSLNTPFEEEILEICANYGVHTLGFVARGGLHYTKNNTIRDFIGDGLLTLFSQSYPQSTFYRKAVATSQKKVELVMADRIVRFTGSSKKGDSNLERLILDFGKGKIVDNKDETDVQQPTAPDPGKPDVTVYTIGHSDHSMEEFIKLLQGQMIDTLIDVRTYPTSKLHPQFNQPNLRSSLNKHSIEYLFLGNKLGGRPGDDDLFNKYGKLEREKMEGTRAYQEGIADVIDLASKKIVALMCSEESPSECHRGYVISHTLIFKEIKVLHIRKGNVVQQGGYIYKNEIDQLELPFTETE